MTSKHTPGPWLFRGKSSSIHGSPAPGEPYTYGEQIARFIDDDDGAAEVSDADLALMIAAPDLLAVARLAIEVLALQRAYFRTRAQSDLIASKQAESRLAKMATAAVSRVDVP